MILKQFPENILITIFKNLKKLII